MSGLKGLAGLAILPVMKSHYYFQSLVMMALLATAPLQAKAAVFADVVDFGQSGKTIDEIVSILNPGAKPNWTHDINDNLGVYSLEDITITDAKLSLEYENTNGRRILGIFFNPERWSIYGLSGTLFESGSIVTQDFPFGESVLASLQSSGEFEVRLLETTSNILDLIAKDSLKVYNSELSGNYTVNEIPSAPEPSTLLVLGLGLAALAIRKKSLLTSKTSIR